MKKLYAGLLGVIILSACGVSPQPGSNTDRTVPGDNRNTTAVSAKIISETTAPAPLTPASFLQKGNELAMAVESLNTAQLVFINHVEQGQSQQDTDLVNIAAAAMNMALIAEQVSLTEVAQPNSNSAASNPYYEISKLGYALVLEAQNAREELRSNPENDAVVAQMIAEYGARLWHPHVTERNVNGNPFVSLLRDKSHIDVSENLSLAAAREFQNALGKDTNVSLFMSVSKETDIKSITFKQPLRLEAAYEVSPDKLVTAAGQQDGAYAKVAAYQALAKSGAKTSTDGGSISTLVSKGMTIAEDPLRAIQNLPVFNNGTARTIKQQVIKGVADQVIRDVADITGVNTPPTITSSARVQSAPPAVSINVQNIVRPQADKVELDVSWSSPEANPDFIIYCNVSGLSQNQETLVKKSGGTVHITIPLSKTPSDNQLEIFCFAKANENSPTLGYKTVNAEVVVTPPSNGNNNGININNNSVTATNTNLNTGSSNTNTSTIVINANQNAPVANANESGSGWIEAYVQGIATRLLNDKKDPVAVAIVIDDLRQCLLGAVAQGKTQAQAKAECAASLAAQANTNSSTTTASSSGGSGPATISVSADFAETITNGAGDSFGSHATLTGDFKAKTVSGTLSGGGTKQSSYDCYLEDDHSKIIDQATAVYSYSYSTPVAGGLDPVSGQFSAQLSFSGPLTSKITKYYSDSRCTHLNDAPELNTTFPGKGTISGTLNPNGTVTFTTKWTSNEASVTGSYAGTGTVK